MSVSDDDDEQLRIIMHIVHMFVKMAINARMCVVCECVFV